MYLVYDVNHNAKCSINAKSVNSIGVSYRLDSNQIPYKLVLELSINNTVVAKYVAGTVEWEKEVFFTDKECISPNHEILDEIVRLITIRASDAIVNKGGKKMYGCIILQPWFAQEINNIASGYIEQKPVGEKEKLENALSILEEVKSLIGELSNDEELDDRFNFYEMKDTVYNYIQSVEMELEEMEDGNES